jgi:hypothetical protein
MLVWGVMAAETPQAKRTRRRRVVWVVLLLLLTTTGWWNWPRGDARFVGRWSAQTSDVPVPGAVKTFRSNGTSTWTFPAKPGKSLSTFWKVEGNKLRCGLPSIKPGSWSLVSAIESWAYTHLHSRPLLHEDVWEIVDVSPDVIELIRPEGRTATTPRIRMTLRRIAE